MSLQISTRMSVALQLVRETETPSADWMNVQAVTFIPLFPAEGYFPVTEKRRFRWWSSSAGGFSESGIQPCRA